MVPKLMIQLFTVCFCFVFVLSDSFTSRDVHLHTVSPYPVDYAIFNEACTTRVLSFASVHSETLADGSYCFIYSLSGNFTVTVAGKVTGVLVGHDIVARKTGPYVRGMIFYPPYLIKAFGSDFTPVIRALVRHRSNLWSAIKPCTAPAVIGDGRGFTTLDCCFDRSLPGCPYLASRDPGDLLLNEHKCVGAYDGYGSVVGTPCEPYYSAESNFSARFKPTSGDWYTDWDHKTVGALPSCSVFGVNDTMVPLIPDLSRCDYVGVGYYNGSIGIDPNINYMFDQLVPRVAGGVYLIVGQVFGKGLNGFLSGSTVTSWLSSYLDQKNAAGIILDLITYTSEEPMSKVSTLITTLCDLMNVNNMDCILRTDRRYISKIDPIVFPKVALVSLVGANFVDYAPTYLRLSGRDRFNENYGEDMEHAVRKLIGFVGPTRLELTISLVNMGYGPGHTPGVSAGASSMDAGQVKPLSPRFPNPNWDTFVWARDLERFQSVGCAAKAGHVLNTIQGEWSYTVCEIKPSGAKFAFRWTYTQPETALESVKHLRQKYGISRVNIYGAAQDPEILRVLFNKLGDARSRQKRSVDFVHYQYPGHAGSGVKDCPGIVYFAADKVITIREYKGCVRPDARYCFYPRSTFTCEFGEGTVAARVETRCQGIDTTTMLPSTPSSKRILCDDMTFYVEGVNVCTLVDHVYPTVQFLPSSGDLPSVLRPVFGEWDVGSKTLALIATCGRLVSPYSCLEYVCRDDVSCVAEFERSVPASMCGPVNELLSEYEYQGSEQLKISEAYKGSILRLLEAAAPYHLGTVSLSLNSTDVRRKRAVSGVVAGVVALVSFIGGVIAGEYGSSDAATINALADKANALSSATVTIAGSTEKFAVAAEHRVAAIEATVNSLITDYKYMQEKLSFRFSTIGLMLEKIRDVLTTLQTQINSALVVGTEISNYAAYLTTMVFRMGTYTTKLFKLQSDVERCVLGLKSRDVSGCVGVPGVAIPLGVRTSLLDGVRYVQIVYLSRELLSYETVREARSFCSNSTLIVAGEGCKFEAVAGTIVHVKGKSGCPSPPVYHPDGCRDAERLPVSTLIPVKEMPLPPFVGVPEVVAQNLSLPVWVNDMRTKVLEHDSTLHDTTLALSKLNLAGLNSTVAHVPDVSRVLGWVTSAGLVGLSVFVVILFAMLMDLKVQVRKRS